MNQLISGIAQGLREGPLVFVAPVVAVWRTLKSTTDDLLHQAGTR